MNKLKPLSIKNLLSKYYPGREVYLSLDGVVEKCRIQTLHGNGNQRKFKAMNLKESFSFSSLPSAQIKNKLTSHNFKSVLLFVVPKNEEIDTSFDASKEELSLAALKYDYKVGDSFFICLGNSFNVRGGVKKYPSLTGEMKKVTIISKRKDEKYTNYIEVETKSKEIIELTINENAASQVNFSFYLGDHPEADFYYYYK